uniref:Sugar phosphate transporter domain-containing protein n=1 Tax=Bicosoecida sp. CB-2014 TaxID=1486930 RepID=A0A7S1C5Y7_9STRA|mmetsp:Transcript_14802/g.51584  ORF Transcript_14802/g.51584 Transcript_14802/m.51584 type:complete len:404 (+) Transcript_14802:442-1653(+)
MKDKTRYLLLVALVALRIFSASTDVLVVKSLNYKLEVRLPLYCALMLNAYGPLWAPIYAGVRWKWWPDHSITWPRVRAYTVLSLFGSVGTPLRMFGMNSLPGSVYVVVSTSNLVFSALLQKALFPSRRRTVFHNLAVGLCASAIILVSLGEEKEEDKQVCDAGSCVDNYAVGFAAVLCAAFLDATKTAVTDRLLDKGARHGPKAALTVFELLLFNAMVQPVMISCILAFSDEKDLWGETFAYVSAQGNTAALVGFSVLLGIGKLTARFSKYQTVAFKTAFFFVLVDTVRRMLTGLAAMVFLGESVTYNKLMGIALSTCGVLTYGYGSHLNKLAKKELDMQKVAMVSGAELVRVSDADSEVAEPDVGRVTSGSLSPPVRQPAGTQDGGALSGDRRDRVRKASSR